MWKDLNKRLKSFQENDDKLSCFSKMNKFKPISSKAEFILFSTADLLLSKYAAKTYKMKTEMHHVYFKAAL